MINAVFYLDNVDNTKTFEGIHDPQDTWDGFAIPYFDKDTAFDVIAHVMEEDIDYLITYNEDTDEFTLVNELGEELFYFPYIFEGHNEKVYNIGAERLPWLVA